MASLAEMERELIVERARAGLEAARKLCRKGGRRETPHDPGGGSTISDISFIMTSVPTSSR
ncbi:hypothetical protein GV368_10555 [Tepidiphilus sp. B18-69]|uniref:Resolvase/invertase-type recombinase catalytic domain-containing protein n=1 Tax=Tepidiphilus baoligensis TaxID=2698687 RepID=A0ABX1QRS9_9PROT|nr:hypothetical protein [Tepidiphilus baoligensis]